MEDSKWSVCKCWVNDTTEKTCGLVEWDLHSLGNVFERSVTSNMREDLLGGQRRNLAEAIIMAWVAAIKCWQEPLCRVLSTWGHPVLTMTCPHCTRTAWMPFSSVCKVAMLRSNRDRAPAWCAPFLPAAAAGPRRSALACWKNFKTCNLLWVTILSLDSFKQYSICDTTNNTLENDTVRARLWGSTINDKVTQFCFHHCPFAVLIHTPYQLRISHCWFSLIFLSPPIHPSAMHVYTWKILFWSSAYFWNKPLHLNWVIFLSRMVSLTQQKMQLNLNLDNFYTLKIKIFWECSSQ